jgi:S-adenosylmethionine-diacylgycerolhomoserine-N-methlytransferase
MGAGTASNLELLGPRLGHLRRVYVVDLARPLLDVARIRVRERGWPSVDVLEADAASVDLPPASVDVVTFSYSLTMMPAWYAVLEHAYDLLRPGGLIGVVDFYTSRKHPPPGWARHPWRTRVFWTLWFAHANVFLSTDHLPYLRHRFTELHAHETRGRVPYLPGCRAPYYVFVGRRPDA